MKRLSDAAMLRRLRIAARFQMHEVVRQAVEAAVDELNRRAREKRRRERRAKK